MYQCLLLYQFYYSSFAEDGDPQGAQVRGGWLALVINFVIKVSRPAIIIITMLV